MDEQFAEGGGDGLPLGPVAAQGRREDRVGAVHAGLPGGGQDAGGAQLDEAAYALGFEVAHPVVEAHGGAYVPDPVLGGAELGRVGGAAGDVGDDRDGRLVEGERAGDAAEFVEHRLHQRRVEGVADVEPLRAVARGVEEGGGRGDRVLGARDDHGAGAVDGGDVDAGGEQGAHLVLGGLDGDHRPALGQRLHQPAARGDQGGRVGEGEDARDVGGGQFAHGVAEEVVGAHPQDSKRRYSATSRANRPACV